MQKCEHENNGAIWHLISWRYAPVVYVLMLIADIYWLEMFVKSHNITTVSWSVQKMFILRPYHFESWKENDRLMHLFEKRFT